MLYVRSPKVKRRQGGAYSKGNRLKNYFKWTPSLLFGLMAIPAARADVIVSGDTLGLLTQTQANQIGTWLGDSNVTLTDIFTKTDATDTPAAFHTAVDGQGPTIVVFVANPITGSSYTPIASSMLVGGYDPLSWNSSGSYNVAATADRSAFIFNLTTTTIQSENTDSSGQTQTYNDAAYGPSFGGGYDLNAGGVLGLNLDAGSAYNYSYGGTSFSTNITGGSPLNQFLVGGLEVFTISSVPEPSAWLLLATLVAVCFLGANARRRRSSRP